MELKKAVSQRVDEYCDQIKKSDDPKKKLALVLEMLGHVAAQIDACWHWAEQNKGAAMEGLTALEGRIEAMESQFEELTKEVRKANKKNGEGEQEEGK